jgi:hypothetical protein
VVVLVVATVAGCRRIACPIWIFREVAQVPDPPRELRVAGQGAMALPWCAPVWLPSCFRVIPCSC